MVHAVMLQQVATSVDVLASASISRRNSRSECDLQLYYLTDAQDSKQFRLSGRYDAGSNDVRVEVREKQDEIVQEHC